MTREFILDETTHLGKPLRHYHQLESTNDLAKELALDAKHHGTAILADFQTRGRGQYGRVWQAPPESSLLLSVLIFPPPEVCRPVLLTALAAVSVCETLSRLISPDREGGGEVSRGFTPSLTVGANWNPRIKWPNDVLIDEKKICGTLIECGHQPKSWVVVGVGLNLNQTRDDFEKQNLPDATSLQLLTGRRQPVFETARTLIGRLDVWYDRLLHGDVRELENVWRDGIGLLSRRVRVSLYPDRERVGTLRELSFDGIVLETIDGEIETHRPEAVRHITCVEESR